MKKILLFLFIFLFLFTNYSLAEDEGYVDQGNALMQMDNQAIENNSNGNSNSDGNNSGSSSDDLTSPDFTIKVNDISPGIVSQGNNTGERVNWLLGTLIQKMMIALGSLSIFIMTIGGGYIVFHNGQDELLSKGKSIFMAGIYAMVVALSSYLLVSIVRYILYT